MVEGRLRMNTVTRQDGVKEKRAEFTLARLHPIGAGSGGGAAPAAMPMAASAPAPSSPSTASAPARQAAPRPTRAAAPAAAAAPEPPTWNASPLVPDMPEGDDEIPF
jgi:single-stranded DNA-binding protein